MMNYFDVWEKKLLERENALKAKTIIETKDNHTDDNNLHELY
jgi:hypothetical protein